MKRKNTKGVFMVSRGDGTVGLYPIERRSNEIMERLEDGQKVFVEVRTPRNPEFSALAHVVFTKIGDAVGLPMESIKLWLKHETGRFDYIKFPDGSVHEHPHSVAFEAMGEEDFRAFWNDCMPIITEQILPKVDEKTFNEIRDMIQGKVDA